jgi:putative nucleotidyltransferase with HDIG domain
MPETTMADMQSKLDAFKQIVIENCQNEAFAYREWFIADHLLIVERIAMELCGKYPEADRDVVFALVWFHDFGKPIDEENEYETTKTRGVEAMESVGLADEFIEKVLAHWLRMEMKGEIDIAEEAIEVQIISTADGASHFVGKFYPSYFRDDPNEDLEGIVKRLKDKITKDWERKIVLPEAREAFRERYQRALEIVGEYPDRFLS